MSLIKFGTDGWRAVIGRDFTPENVGKVIQAFADIYPKLPDAGKPIAIGYDRRAHSEESAKLAAEVLAGNGIRSRLSSQFCPTPCVSWNVVREGGAAGIMITASHNPPEWNGIKFKENYGGAASPEYVAPIEKMILQNDSNGRTARCGKIPSDLISTFDPKGGYTAAIRNFVNLRIIRDARFKVLSEPMYGSGTGFFSEFIECSQIHTAADTTFGGLQPEPIPPHINEAIEETVRGGYDVCLVTDGDADRIGAVDEAGNFVNPHQIFSLILKHLVTVRKLTGRVIKSITTTRMLNHLCKKYGLELTTTPVGFKYISPLLNQPGVIMGGEESGGIGIPLHVCERDGILNGLLILEIMATHGKKLSELTAELQKEAGPCYYRRIDMHLDNTTVGRAKDRLSALDITELGGRKIIEASRMDGYYFLRDDESWLLIRPSGTEPLLRMYAEAHSPEDVETLLTLANEFIGV